MKKKKFRIQGSLSFTFYKEITVEADPQLDVDDEGNPHIDESTAKGLLFEEIMDDIRNCVEDEEDVEIDLIEEVKEE